MSATRVVPDDWRNLVVLVSGSRWDGTKYASHHVAKALAQYAPVLYVDPPLSPKMRLKAYGLRGLAGFGLRIAQPRIAVVTPPALPFPGRAALVPFTNWLIRRATRRATRALGSDVHAVLLFAPGRALFGVCGERIAVYYAKDDFSAATDLTGGSAERARAAEQWAADHADIVVAHSPILMDRWRAYDPIFIPNGVDPDAFASAPVTEVAHDVELARPIVGFVGAISNRIDLSLLEAIVNRGRSLLLIGHQQTTFAAEKLDRLRSLPNVQWIGRTPYEALPSYLAAMDVGIVPYTDTAFNRASFPLKTLEYLAAGLPVVSTPLPAIEWLATSLIRMESEAGSFADAVDDAIREGVGPEPVAARQAFAREHSWEARVRTLAGVLGLLADEGSTG